MRKVELLPTRDCEAAHGPGIIVFYINRLQRGSKTVISGVASGWHGWTMSRGPELKGAPRDREKKKKMKKRKEKKRKEKKREEQRPQRVCCPRAQNVLATPLTATIDQHTSLIFEHVE